MFKVPSDLLLLFNLNNLFVLSSSTDGWRPKNGSQAYSVQPFKYKIIDNDYLI